MSKKTNTPEEHHQELVKGFHDQLKEIFDSSEQAIYLYLDDNHKICNKKFAEMQGFSSPEEWAKVENPLEVGVDKMSQDTVFGSGVARTKETTDVPQHQDAVQFRAAGHRG